MKFAIQNRENFKLLFKLLELHINLQFSALNYLYHFTEEVNLYFISKIIINYHCGNILKSF